MNEASDAGNRAQAVRGKTLAALTALAEQGKAFDLPAPPPGLELCSRKLQDNTHQVLVVGEAKRGKSTFVNALIGRPLLPTDVDIATSQVFRICPAEQEAYRLRFEDDSQQSITAADLPRYGSQVIADREGVPRLDEMIRWIEVDVPVRFLPADVRLLDTPGLGALYAAHAQITYRFVPHADAVLFVLDSQAPISAPELRFIENVLDVTRNLFFIQTKIDQFRKDSWQEIQRRNQEILKQRFADRIPDMRVWPFSSTNLAKVAATNDEDYLQVSRYPELAAALQAFLYRVTGWDRAAVATVLAQDYHAQARSVLARRLAGLTGEPGTHPDGAKRAAERAQFAADWAETGPRHQELRGQLRAAANAARRSFTKFLQPGSSLETEQRTNIDALMTTDEVKEFAENLSGHIVATVSKRWQAAIDQFGDAAAEALTPLLQAARRLDAFSPKAGSAADDPAVSLSTHHGLNLQGDYYQRFKSAGGEFTSATLLSVTMANMGLGLALSVGVAAPVLVAAIPVLVILAVGVGVLGAARGWSGAAAKELQAVRQKLHKHLNSSLAQIRQQFLEGDAGSAHSSMVDDYFHTRVHELDQQANRLVKHKLAELDAESDRLQKDAQLDGERRQVKAEETRRQLQDWDGVGSQLKEIQADLQDLERSWQPGPLQA